MALDVIKLCKILCVSPANLDLVLKEIDKYYYLISNPKINKKTGLQFIDKLGKPRTRDLYPSKGILKDIQVKLYHRILKPIKLPSYAFGGIEKRDNILNAKTHQGNKFFFNTDLRNYYPSIDHKQVFSMLVSRGFTTSIASTITKLTTFKGQLPQGTSTSPYIANLVFVNTGNQLKKLADKYNLTFTTFVDDITLSSKTDFQEIVPEIIEIITSNGFLISHDKTFYQTSMPKVTNVIVMNNGIYLSKTYKEKIDGFEDKTIPTAKGTINYYKRVQKISNTKSSQIKKKLLG
ncbi:reverse transcriptase family protein [Pedobacter sp. Leaf170]|uniref:reverse transcriptase family protein n=1 Tax=Pedobacter sp. Leaf170 TaxID=2876558 RepID=UPI001E2C4110|nr:reverse transcriptase family protein [Pedobacter sp. Leaf170]